MMTMAFVLPSMAQKKGADKDCDSRRKEMMEIKIDFLAKEIDLSTEQKAQFTPLYTQMENERWALLKRIKAAKKSLSGNKNASDADYEKATKEINAAKTQMGQVEAKYEKKFAAFLSKKQLYKLKEAEADYYRKCSEARDKKKHKKK